jgi:acetolactate decarboxylase
MLSRRRVIKATLGACNCIACWLAQFASSDSSAQGDQPTHFHGSGYDLRFIGAQQDTIMNGRLAAAIDLRGLAMTRHLYAIGPIEQLRGEVTIIDSRPALARVGTDGALQVIQTFEAGAPFLVWAEVPAWQTLPVPTEVRSFSDLAAFVPHSAAKLGFDPQQPIPFLVQGREDLIEFHILNRKGDEPHSPQKHKSIQVAFELMRADSTIVGFYSVSHRGVFTPIDSTIHIHFQTPDNTSSGHIQMLEIGPGAILSLPHKTNG